MSTAGSAEMPVYWHGTLDSTNIEAARLVVDGKAHACWVMARVQKAGRGRSSRSWASPDGNFMGTRLWEVGEDLARVSLLSLAVGMAVRQTVSHFLDETQSAKMKWPNDIYIGLRKICGILIETHRAPGGAYWAAIGIGVNLAHAPSIADGRSAFQLGEGGKQVAPEMFLASLDPALKAVLAHWPPNAERFAADWAQNAFGVGEAVTVSSDQTGSFLGITAQGAARVSLDSGGETVVHAGDLVFDSLEKARDAAGD